MATYTWVFPSLDVAPSEGGMTNVVKSVYWRLGASDGTNMTDIYGTQTLASPDPNAFLAFDDLTEATVQGWVEAAMGEERVAQMKAALDAQLERIANPPIVTQNPPWS